MILYNVKGQFLSLKAISLFSKVYFLHVQTENLIYSFGIRFEVCNAVWTEISYRIQQKTNTEGIFHVFKIKILEKSSVDENDKNNIQIYF